MKNLKKLFILAIACALAVISLVSCEYTPLIQAEDEAQQTSIHNTLVDEGLGNVFDGH